MLLKFWIFEVLIFDYSFGNGFEIVIDNFYILK